MTYAVFDIETRIDKALVKAVYAPRESIGDEVAYQRTRAQLLEQTGSDFFPPPFHVPIVIAVANVSSDWELTEVEVIAGAPEAAMESAAAEADGKPQAVAEADKMPQAAAEADKMPQAVAEADKMPQAAAEAEMIRAFWERVEQFRGTLVSFNGRNFDLPVLELQALRHGCVAPRYFNERYGHRHRYSEQGHYDLYDFLSNYGMVRLRGGFQLLARLVGLPGKTDVSGADVQGLWEAGRHQDIVAYCRRDVIQTYLLFLRVELMRGRLALDRYDRVVELAAPFRRELGAG